MRKLVHISGIGTITAAGNNVSENWEDLVDGKVAISQLESLSSWESSKFNGAEVKLSNEGLLDLLDDDISSHKSLPCERGEILFFIALEEALKSAGLNKEDLKKKRVGVFIGSDIAGITCFEEDYRSYLKLSKKPSLKSELVFPMQTILDRVAYEFGIVGPRFIYSTACSASLHAVIWGSEFIKSGEIDIAITGGTDPMSAISISGFSSLNALALEACSPFSTTDRGISVGEGAGVLVLESSESLKERGHKSKFGFIAGYAGTSDAYHQTASDPTGRGIKDCIEQAVKNCDVDTLDKIYVSAHGTGTEHNDKVETRALKQVFTKPDKLLVSSLKSMIGHTLGASGAIELALMAHSFEKKEFLPTANFTDNRPGCDLQYIKNKSLKTDISLGIKNSFAFGGNNTCVALTNDSSLINSNDGFVDEDIAIIGIGSITCCGLGIDSVERDYKNNKTSITENEHIGGFIREKSKATKVGKVSDELIKDACKTLRLKNHRKMDRISKLASIAATSACKDAGLKINSENTRKIALIGNTSSGHVESVDDFFTEIVEGGLESGDPNKFPNTVLNAHLGHVAVELKVKGYSTVTVQSNSLVAIELAKKILLSGQADTVIVGASSEYCETMHKGFIDTGVISNDMQLYTKKSNGYILGEGSVFLVLEKRTQAEKNNRNPYGYIKNVKTTGMSIFPSSNRFDANPLNDLAINLDRKSNISAWYGTGSGIWERDKYELDCAKSYFPNRQLIAYSLQTGYIRGVMGVLNIAAWAKSDKKSAITTEITEGGLVGYSHLLR